MICTGTVIIAIGVAIFLIELGMWLKTGAWPGYNLPWLLGVAPATGWLGFDRIVAWLWPLPFWGIVTGVGAVPFVLGTTMESNSLETWRRTLPESSPFSKKHDSGDA
jgi:hypothetical protein